MKLPHAVIPDHPLKGDENRMEPRLRPLGVLRMKTILLNRKLLNADELMERLDKNNGFRIRNTAVQVCQSQSIHVT